MPDLQVITFCTRRAGLIAQYEEQLSRAGIAFHVESLAGMQNGDFGSLGARLTNCRRLVEKFKDSSKIVFTDAWDVLFYGTAEEVYEKIPIDRVLIAAERNCWPDTYMAPYYPGKSVWRFVNGGLQAGTPEQLMQWIDGVEKHPCYHPGYIDQHWMNLRLLDGSFPIPLDTETNLFYCMVGEAGELLCKDARPINSITGTRPNFIHFNSKHDPTMFLWKWAVSAGMITSETN